MAESLGLLWTAASFGISVQTNRNTYKINEAQNKIGTEQARLQAAEAAYERSKQFTENISMNLALKGIGMGGVSGFRGATAKSTEAFNQDISSLRRQDVFAQITGEANKALNKARKMAGNVGAVSNAAALASNLGLFKGK